MRFLHTSDWHLGRTIRGHSRFLEHEAVLRQVLDYSIESKIDCLLISGDIFDSSSPSPESEKLFFNFLRGLLAEGIRAVIIAGNHDHPLRFAALQDFVAFAGIFLVGEPVSIEHGGVIRLRSLDGHETATIACLPWVQERFIVRIGDLTGVKDQRFRTYASEYTAMCRHLEKGFQHDTVNIFLSHVLTDKAQVGRGERELHLNSVIYGVSPGALPRAQYAALGHVHKWQVVRESPRAYYSGSLLQLDFGEVDQQKFVNLVEAKPGRPAEVTPLPLTGGRQLFDIGSPTRGVSLEEIPAYAEKMGDAWLRVFVDLDLPVANLPSLVREHLPNAVDVQRAKPQGAESAAREPAGRRSAEEMFAAFYRSSNGRGKEPAPATMTLFRKLLDEVSHETADA